MCIGMSDLILFILFGVASVLLLVYLLITNYLRDTRPISAKDAKNQAIKERHRRLKETKEKFMSRIRFAASLGKLEYQHKLNDFEDEEFEEIQDYLVSQGYVVYVDHRGLTITWGEK